MTARRLLKAATIIAALPLSAMAQTLWAPGTVGNNTTNSNVGVGTSAPTEFFTVLKSTNGQAVTGLFSNPNTGTGAYGEVQFGNNASARNFIIQSYGSNYSSSLLANGAALYTATGNLVFGTAFTNRMTILAGGEVGIGTTAPGAALDVIKPGNNNVYENGIRANRPDAAGQYAFMGYAPSSADAYFGSVYTGSAGTYGAIHLRQYTQGMAFRDVLNIDSDGDVGIGITSPSAKFSVVHSGQLNVDIDNTGAGNALIRIDRQTTIGESKILFEDGGSTQWSIGAASSSNDFVVRDADSAARVTISKSNGRVGIGTSSPTHLLSVNGTVRATEIIVDTGWADHVFSDGYPLASLAEVEAYIREQKRLPGIPSAEEVADRGISVGEIQAKLLEKVEELTLHQIAQLKVLEQQARLIAAQQRQIDQLQEALNGTTNLEPRIHEGDR